MRRREYMVATAAAATTVGLAGCSGGSGPAATVEQFYSALQDGDTERATELVHSESPMAGSVEMAAGMLSEMDFSVDSTEVLEESDSRATVEVTVTVTMSGETETSTETVELRKEDGEWKLWE